MHGVVTSTEFERPELVAEDLLGGTRGVSGVELGMLICAAGIDYAGVLKKVSAEVDFPIVGGTTLAFPVTGRESNPVSASLALLPKGKIRAASAVSGVLDPDRAAEQMRALYEEARAALGGEPRLIVPYIPLLPSENTAGLVSALFEISEGVPVFGGLCTGDLISAPAYVFADGKALPDRMVLVLLGGEINPVFAVGNSITVMSEYAPEVTAAEANVIEKVDGVPFCDYLKSLGITPQDRISGVDAIVQYGPLPVLVRYKGQPDDGVPEVRCVHYTDVQKGTAGFSAAIPVGARVTMGILRPDDVARSAEDCLSRLMDAVGAGQAVGYTYSVLFCVSCVGRYFVYVGAENQERRILDRVRQMGLAVSDFYGLCEIGPTLDKSGRTINRSHSASIAMCAF